MRASFSAALVASALLASPALAQVGKTEITIGAPQYSVPLATAKVPITMELDSTTKGYVSHTIVVTKKGLLGDTPVGHSSTLSPPPEPGKGPITIHITFDVVKGATYRINAAMTFKDKDNKETYVEDKKTITP